MISVNARRKIKQIMWRCNLLKPSSGGDGLSQIELQDSLQRAEVTASEEQCTYFRRRLHDLGSSDRGKFVVLHLVLLPIGFTCKLVVFCLRFQPVYVATSTDIFKYAHDVRFLHVRQMPDPLVPRFLFPLFSQMRKHPKNINTKPPT